MPDPREVLIEAERRYPMNRVVDDPEGAAGWAETDPYGYDEHAREAFVAGAEWYRSAVETAVTAYPQEALREAVREVLSECRVSVHTAPWVEELDGYVVRLELGRVNAEALADAVLPVVQAHTQALGEEIEELAVELADERTLHQALWDAVSRLADDLEREADGECDRDESWWQGHAGGLEHAARRLRSLLGDKEAQQ